MNVPIRTSTVSIGEFFTPWNYYARIEVADRICNKGYGIALKVIGSKTSKTKQSEIKRGITAITRACGGSVSKTQVKSLLLSNRSNSKKYIKMPFNAPEILNEVLRSVDPCKDELFENEKKTLLMKRPANIGEVKKVEVLIWKYLAKLENASERIDDRRFASLMTDLRRMG